MNSFKLHMHTEVKHYSQVISRGYTNTPSNITIYYEPASDGCQYACRITCPTNSECTINCTEAYSCQSATFTCPTNSNCTINCDGPSSCRSANVTCPTGDYSCNILCTDFLSCSDLSITNTHNVNIKCCGDLSCVGAGMVPKTAFHASAVECS